MNCTKVVPPLPIFINIYYYYSSFTLILSLIITPLLFYIILTKSKNLKNFKWLILNHTFWCFFLEIFYSTIKPLFLPPSLSGFALSFLSNGNVKISTFVIFFLVFLIISVTVSLSLTLMNRYLAAIPPNAMSRCLLKTGIMCAVIISSIAYIADAASFYPIFIKPESETFEEAIKYDSCLKYYISTESSYIFVSHEYMKTYLHILFIFLVLLIAAGIFLNIYFVIMIKAQKSQTLAKLQLSLTISATIQLLITVAFLLIPTLIFVSILCFEISHSENLLCIVFCFSVTHSLLESCVTLYFVLPYRKGVIEIVNNIQLHLPESWSNAVSVVNHFS